MNYLLIAIGGGLGSILRYVMQSVVGHLTGMDFPYGTLIVNISGSIVMGLFIGWMSAHTDLKNANDVRLFIAIGILGGYTTFSSFSLDAIVLYEKGKLMAMAVYVVSSVVISLLGVFAGLKLMRMFA